MQAYISKHVVLLSCLCLDHNCSLGSQNKICQVILAEGQTDWTEFLPDTMRLTSVESHSDSSLFSTFKHKIGRGFKVGRWKHCWDCLPEISFVLACRKQRVISHEDSLFDQILWLHTDRNSGLLEIQIYLTKDGETTKLISSSHPSVTVSHLLMYFPWCLPRMWGHWNPQEKPCLPNGFQCWSDKSTKFLFLGSPAAKQKYRNACLFVKCLIFKRWNWCIF